MTCDPRPPRKHITIAVKREVIRRQNGLCACGCGQPVSEKPKTDTCWDHTPALRLRDICECGTDYVPHQLDPRYIDALRTACHRRKTSGTGATTAGTDIGKIKKERKRAEKAGKRKRKWARPKMNSGELKLKPKRNWGSRPLEGPSFPKAPEGYSHFKRRIVT